MQLNTTQLLKNLDEKRTIRSPIYLLYSNYENIVLIDYLVKHIKQPLLSFTQHSFIVDRYFDYKLVQELLASASLFADGVYIELQYKTKPTVSQQQEIVNLLMNIPDNTYLVITTDKLNKAEFNSKWLSRINDLGVIVAVYENDAEIIIAQMLKENNQAIHPQALKLLLEQNQGNPTLLLQEVKRFMLLYPAQHTLSVEDIQCQNSTNENAQYTIYNLSNAYLLGNLKQAIKILDNILQQGEDHILITWLLSEDIRKLLIIKARMLKEKEPFGSVIKNLNIWSSNQHNFQQAVVRLSYANLLKIFANLATLDAISKGVISDSDGYIQLVNILTSICIPTL